jgi:hypothetical protein
MVFVVFNLTKGTPSTVLRQLLIFFTLPSTKLSYYSTKLIHLTKLNSTQLLTEGTPSSALGSSNKRQVRDLLAKTETLIEQRKNFFEHQMKIAKNKLGLIQKMKPPFESLEVQDESRIKHINDISNRILLSSRK